MDFVAEIHC